MRIFILVLGLLTFNAFPHGNGRPGPHGGEIQMPGNFHVELVKGNHEVKIYLLDMQFKNAIVHHSSVEASAKDERLNCRPTEDYFKCEVPHHLLQEQIKVSAQRLNAKGTTTYPALAP